MTRLLRGGALFLSLGCLILWSGCGAAGGQDNADAPTTVRQQTLQTPGGETLVGTEGADVLRAGKGEDVVRGLGGDDTISGGEGRDRLSGGPGDDLVDAQDPGSRGEAGRDGISCGPGRDEVLMDAEDGEKPKDCEMAGVGQS